VYKNFIKQISILTLNFRTGKRGNQLVKRLWAKAGAGFIRGESRSAGRTAAAFRVGRLSPPESGS